jgi:hypothetical protein
VSKSKLHLSPSVLWDKVQGFMVSGRLHTALVAFSVA